MRHAWPLASWSEKWGNLVSGARHCIFSLSIFSWLWRGLKHLSGQRSIDLLQLQSLSEICIQYLPASCMKDYRSVTASYIVNDAVLWMMVHLHVKRPIRNAIFGFCGLWFITGCLNRGAIRARYGISNFSMEFKDPKMNVYCQKALPACNRSESSFVFILHYMGAKWLQ